MKLDWGRILGCAGALVFCVGTWLALGILAVDWYLKR